MRTPSPVLFAWLQQLQRYSQAQANAWDQPAGWLHPSTTVPLPQGKSATWNADLHEGPASASSVFSRAWQEEVVQEAHRKISQSSPQPTPAAYLATAQIEGDLLAASQRAYCARHSSFVQDQLLAAKRLQGLGRSQGIFAGGWINHLSALQRQGES